MSSKKEKEILKQQRKNEKKMKSLAKSERKQFKQELEGEEDIQLVVKKLISAKETAVVNGSGTWTVLESQPSPRVQSSVLVALTGEVYVYGGQYFDGNKVNIYGDLYKWEMDTNVWKQWIGTVPTSSGSSAPAVVLAPPPRTAHQAVIHTNSIYLFGGEYSTTRQFYHYKDFWKFDIKTSTWSELKVTGIPPSQRSGHRMIVWKSYIVLFGGFYDTFRDSYYFNDLYFYHVTEQKWEKVEFSPSAPQPPPRGGGCFFLNGTEAAGAAGTAFLFGGYVRDKKASGQALDDLWQLTLRVPPAKPSWERLSKKGSVPVKRSGMSYTVYKNRCIFFGGVKDEEKQGMSLDSTFYNDLYCFDMTRKRFYVLEYQAVKEIGLDGKKSRRKKKAIEEDNDSSDEQAELRESQHNGVVLKKFEWMFEYVDADGKMQQMIIEEEPEPEAPQVVSSDEVAVETSVDSVIPEVVAKHLEEPPTAPATPASSDFPLPSARISGALFMKNHQLVLLGGLSESGDKEITYDDCWTLDLRTREKWVQKLEGTMHVQKWLGDEESEPSDEEWNEAAKDDSFFDSTSSEDDASEGFSDADDPAERRLAEDPAEPEEPKKKEKKTLKQKMADFQTKHDLDDESRTPSLNENLKDFFARTKEYWMEAAQSSVEQDDAVKDLRRIAFGLCQTRFDALRPVLDKLRSFEESQKVEEAKNDKKSTSKDKKSKK
jgi:N-acetylneuraminic acid mutarotase